MQSFLYIVFLSLCSTEIVAGSGNSHGVWHCLLIHHKALNGSETKKEEEKMENIFTMSCSL